MNIFQGFAGLHNQFGAWILGYSAEGSRRPQLLQGIKD